MKKQKTADSPPPSVHEARAAESRARIREEQAYVREHEALAEVAYLRDRLSDSDRKTKQLETDLQKERAKVAKASSSTELAQAQEELERLRKIVATRTPSVAVADEEKAAFADARVLSLEGRIVALTERVTTLKKEAGRARILEDELTRLWHELKVLFTVPEATQKQLVTAALQRSERHRKREREEGEITPPQTQAAEKK